MAHMKAHIVCSWMLIVTLLAACGGVIVIPAPPSASKAAADLKVTAQRDLKLDSGQILSLSPDGKWLAVIRDTAVCIVAVDTLADKQCANLETGPIDRRSVVWSPDNRRIAFTEDLPRLLFESDLWVLDIDSGKLSDLTDDGLKGDMLNLPREKDTALDSTPAWSPDSQSLLFSRSDRMSSTTALYQIPAGGGTPQKLLDVAGTDLIAVWYGPRWLSNGRIVYTVFQRTLTDPANGVWIADSNGQNAKQLVSIIDPQLGAPILGDLSAKGDRALMWYSNALQFAARPNVSYFALLDLNSGQTTELKPQGEFTSLANAAFSPDGSKILYVYRDASQQTHLVVRDAPSTTDHDLYSTSTPFGLNEAMQGLYWASNDTVYAATSPGSGILFTLGSP